MNSEDKKETSLDQMGSEEFYEGEKKEEKPEVPVEKEEIKAETVKKEEIYEDKIKKQEAFIANLGRRKEAEKNPEDIQPEYGAENNPQKKKMIFSILAIVILLVIVASSYGLWSRNKNKTAPKELENNSVAVVNQLEDKTEEKQPEPEKVPVAEIKPAEIKIKILNEGAPAGSAGKNKDFLVSKGYAKTEAGNGELDSVNSFIYYNGEKFKSAAEKIKELLTENKIKASAKEALTSEQKSADIVIVLGKS